MYNIATCNTAGFRQDRIDALKILCNDNNIDIILLQETHINKTDAAKQIDRQLNCRSYWSFGTTAKTGVGICILNRKN